MTEKSYVYILIFWSFAIIESSDYLPFLHSLDSKVQAAASQTSGSVELNDPDTAKLKFSQIFDWGARCDAALLSWTLWAIRRPSAS